MEKRNIREILKEIEDVATIDIDIALSCFYVMFDNGKPFVGISVRFAEIIASSWTNIDSGASVIKNDGEYVLVEGYVKDKEKNSTFSVQVSRKITDYKGFPLPSEQIVLATTTASSIAFRNAVFKAIPAAIFTTAVKNIKNFIMQNMDGSAVLTTTTEFFYAKGITEKQLIQRLNKDSLSDLKSDDLFTLIGIKNAIEEGSTSIKNIFGSDFNKKTHNKGSKFANMFDKDVDEPADLKSQVSKTFESDVYVQNDTDGYFYREYDKKNPKPKKDKFPRPKGRTPKGKMWDGNIGKFVPIKDMR